MLRPESQLTLIPFLNPHLSLKLVDFLLSHTTLPQNELQLVKLRLLESTCLSEQYQQVLSQAKPSESVPELFSNKCKDAAAKVEDFSKNLSPSLEALKEALSLPADFNYQQYLEYGTLLFEFGRYTECVAVLQIIRKGTPSPTILLQTLWGLFAATILLENWTDCPDIIAKLQEVIDSQSQTLSYDSLLFQRTWLVHHILFCSFSSSDLIHLTAETFIGDKYATVLQHTAPGLLRYFVASALCSRHRHKSHTLLRDCISIVEKTAPTSEDPLLAFLLHCTSPICEEKSVTDLKALTDTINNDFFLEKIRERLLDAAYLLLIENILRTHNGHTIKTLSAVLKLDDQQTEAYITTLSKTKINHLEVKLDVKTGEIVATKQHHSQARHMTDRLKSQSEKFQSLKQSLRNKH
ncbi:putative Eukaryotic translation initiation factor 3 subunit E [Blattamonas nauphoetae]|uniref:Eukaryotic translation initiation factor 3 subunit E n=1 Tax=Blattamonas nauphoetae TaxID=2049346 RepID=A0ABQ9XAZ2_9EUKA|nr:putative Eukaryotic translation initiation factor 3 subunit E [Blattamonas nauphoetae]